MPQYVLIGYKLKLALITIIIHVQLFTTDNRFSFLLNFSHQKNKLIRVYPITYYEVVRKFALTPILVLQTYSSGV